jgi:hypothetical protein
MAQAQFPQLPDLDLPVSQRIGYGDNKHFGKWTVANPHPGYGKDPNIGNELGHTVYPKYVKAASGEMVIVHSKAQEDALPKPETEDAPDVEHTDWVQRPVALKDDGPTVKEYVEAGYKASEYPPKGYASKSTQEEIDEYKEAEKSATAHHGWK